MALYLAALIALASGACSSELPSEADDPPADATGTVPVVSRVEPRTLPRGATLDLRIFGSGFDPASRILLRAREVSGTGVITNSTRYMSSSELTANVTTAADAPAGPYEVVVTSGAGKQGVGTELVDLAPHISGIAPSPAEVGQTVNISGSGFGLDRSSVRVTFDGFEGSVLSARDGMVVAVVPEGVSTGTVVVELSVAGFPIPASFDLDIMDPIPQISAISPSTAEPGQIVTISGYRFMREDPEGEGPFPRVILSTQQGVEIEVPLLDPGPTRNWIVIAVPFEIPAGLATLRVISPHSAVPAEAPLTIILNTVRDEPTVPNVAGWYTLSPWDYCLIEVFQDGTSVSLWDGCEVLVGGGAVRVTGTLSPEGNFRGEASFPGSCERYRLFLTFSPTGYLGFSECENSGVVVDRSLQEGYRMSVSSG